MKRKPFRSTRSVRPTSPPGRESARARPHLHRLRLRRRRDEPYAEDAPLAPSVGLRAQQGCGGVGGAGPCPQAWIVRTAWLYGAGGPNFVKTMARLPASARRSCRGRPAGSADLDHGRRGGDPSARRAGRRSVCGTRRARATPRSYGLARAIFEELGLDPARVTPTTSRSLPPPAPRPAYSACSATTRGGWRGSRRSRRGATPCGARPPRSSRLTSAGRPPHGERHRVGPCSPSTCCPPVRRSDPLSGLEVGERPEPHGCPTAGPRCGCARRR